MTVLTLSVRAQLRSVPACARPVKLWRWPGVDAVVIVDGRGSGLDESSTVVALLFPQWARSFEKAFSASFPSRL